MNESSMENGGIHVKSGRPIEWNKELDPKPKLFYDYSIVSKNTALFRLFLFRFYLLLFHLRLIWSGKNLRTKS